MKDIITNKLYKNVCTILKQARESAARAVNFSMVQACWLVGKIIKLLLKKNGKDAF